VKNKLLSWELKPWMCESIKLSISAGGLLVPVVFGGDCAKDTGAVKASAVVAIAARRVGFGMDFVLSFAMGNGGDAFAAE
jgi:hypothetical protein